MSDELIAALVGATVAWVFTIVATSLQSRHDAQQTVRLATAERLHQTYGEMLAAAWVRDDATGTDSWNVTRREDWEIQVLRSGDVARARLSLEEPDEVKAIDQCYRDVGRDYFQWRLRLRDREFEEFSETRKEMEALHNTIKSKTNELKTLCKEHVAELRAPLSPWWQVWKSSLDR